MAATKLTDGFIVELEAGVYVAEWSGDPGRTSDIGSAKVYQTEVAAINGKAQARRYRKFANARIHAVTMSAEGLEVVNTKGNQ